MKKKVVEGKISNVNAISKYFSEGKNGRKIEMAEWRDLSSDDRAELGDLARRELFLV